jgi:hypothetical protein
MPCENCQQAAIFGEDGEVEIPEQIKRLQQQAVRMEGPKEPIDQMSIKIMGSHHPHSGQQQAFNINVSRVCTTREGFLFHPPLLITQEWKKLDFHWVKHPWAVVIQNNAGKGRTTHPTAEELEALKESILEVAAREGGEAWPIDPGMCFISQLSSTKEVWVRSQKGEIPIGLHVYPQ